MHDHGWIDSETQSLSFWKITRNRFRNRISGQFLTSFHPEFRRNAPAATRRISQSQLPSPKRQWNSTMNVHRSTSCPSSGCSCCVCRGYGTGRGHRSLDCVARNLRATKKKWKANSATLGVLVSGCHKRVLLLRTCPMWIYKCSICKCFRILVLKLITPHWSNSALCDAKCQRLRKRAGRPRWPNAVRLQSRHAYLFGKQAQTMFACLQHQRGSVGVSCTEKLFVAKVKPLEMESRGSRNSKSSWITKTDMRLVHVI